VNDSSFLWLPAITKEKVLPYSTSYFIFKIVHENHGVYGNIYRDIYAKNCILKESFDKVIKK